MERNGNRTMKHEAERLSPLHNVVFACIFRDERKSGVAMLEFLNAILEHVKEEPVVEIISMNSEYPMIGESSYEKYGRLDVRVKAESGRLFDIEVQIKKDYMNERGFFYGGRLGMNELESGVSYDRMPQVMVINIVDFYVRDDHDNVVEPVVLCYKNNPGELATDRFKMYHIQLPAFRREHKTLDSVKGNAFFTWLYMLDKGYKEADEMETLAKMTEGLENFARQYNYAIDDPDLIWHYWSIEDGKRDVATQISVAVTKAAKKARTDGIEEGKAEKNYENAKGFKEKGVDPKIIMEVTGLSLDEIAKL